MTISFVGSGNMASQLVRIFKDVGLNVNGLYSRNIIAGIEICTKYMVPFIDKVEDIKADIIMLCVSDDSISAIAKYFENSKSIVVHTSGSVTLKNIYALNKGVFYPMQTMSKNSKVDFKDVPIFITASNSFVSEALHGIASLLCDKVYDIDDEKRQHMHLAAVITNNFINHIVVKSKNYLESNDLDYEMIVPLLKTTFEKLCSKPYNFTQTGPAKRGDQNVIIKQLSLLNKDFHLKNIYESITNSINNYENNT